MAEGDGAEEERRTGRRKKVEKGKGKKSNQPSAVRRNGLSKGNFEMELQRTSGFHEKSRAKQTR